MTKKHFEEFAAMLASHSPSQDEPTAYQAGYEAARQDLGRSFAAICRLHNPRFDAVRFYRAASLIE